MRLELKGHRLYVYRETGDPSYYRSSSGYGGGPESRLLHHVKGLLNEAGARLVKVRMVVDGHLVSEHVYYLRPPRKGGHRSVQVGIYNDNYQLYDAGKQYNKKGTTNLLVVPCIGDEDATEEQEADCIRQFADIVRKEKKYDKPATEYWAQGPVSSIWATGKSKCGQGIYSVRFAGAIP